MPTIEAAHPVHPDLAEVYDVDSNPYNAAIEESLHRVATARDPENITSIDGSISVSIPAEELSQALNFRSSQILEANGSTLRPVVTAERAAIMLQRTSPDSQKMIDRALANYRAAQAESKSADEAGHGDTIRAFTGTEILQVNQMREAEARESLDALNQTSLALLEGNPTNNSGIGDRDFAIARLNANTLELHLQGLDGLKPETDQNQHGERLDRLVAEGNLWQKIVDGKHITQQEAFAVAKHARTLRKAYASPTAEQSTPTPEAKAPEQAKTKTYEDLLDTIPTDDESQAKFIAREFGSYNPAKEELFKAYLVTRIRQRADAVRTPIKQPDGSFSKSRFPDNSSSFLGTGLDGAVEYLAGAVSSRSGGRPVFPKELATVRFSSLCKDYLGLDVFKDMPDYTQHFNPAAGKNKLFEN